MKERNEVAFKHFNFKRLAHAAVAVVAATATLALGGVTAGTAMADPPKPHVNGDAPANGIAFDNLEGGYDGWLGGFFLGNKGEQGYCFDWGLPAAIMAYATMNWVPAANSDQANRVGWILRQADTDTSMIGFTHEQKMQNTLDRAAAAVIVHDQLDKTVGKWQQARQYMNTHRSEVGHGWQELWSGVGPGGGQYIGDFTIGQVLDRADELWAQSAGHVAGTGAVPDKSYKDAQRHLTTRNIWYKDANGAYVSTKVTVKLHEGARFDAAANGMYGGTLSADGMTWTGSTQTNLGDAGLQLPFTATRDGDGRYDTTFENVVYTYQYPTNPNGHQRMAKWGAGQSDPEMKASQAFKMQWTFQPQASTEASTHKLEVGGTPTDKVTSSVGDLLSGTGADGTTRNTWNGDTKATFKGYFFTSADQSVLTQVKRNANETPAQYLARVKAKYGEPAATAETTFTGSGQTNTVTAKTATGDDWTVPADMGGYYGTWVWTFEKAGQQPDLQNRFTGDYVAEAGVASENAVVHTEAHAASQTANATIAPNGELADRITITGLPENLGKYKPSDSLPGVGADNTKATVDVYWTGRKAGAVSNQDDDMLYQPSTKDAPADDANHKHIATYTYDLAKLIAAQKGYKSGDPLTLTVGGGANGSKTADGKTVTLKADKGTGFYAFVFRYAGCDRVTGVTSAYNDPFERVFVQDSKQVTLTSHANPNRVKVGDRFHDTAKISGRYPAKYLDGAYVEFTAYEPVSGEPDMTAAKLLDAERHPLTADQIDKLANGTEFEVSSSDVAADKAGTVNWQATLFTKDGIRLAGHEFGATDESVEVTGNGKVRSVSQKQGAVGGRMWDLIQVSNVTTGSDRGNVPAGSKVVVDVYKHQGEDGANKGQLVESKTFPVDVARLRNGSDSYWFKAEMSKTYPASGRYYWTERLVDNYGNTLDRSDYGDQDEQTDVQEYSTDTAKKWLSDDNALYSDKTVKTFDILTQTWFKDWGADAHRDTEGDETQSRGVTADGTRFQTSIWRQNGSDSSKDEKVVDGKANAMPNIDRKAAKAGRMYQKVKSETFSLSNLEPGTYYYGLKVTNDQDAANLAKYVGEKDGGLVYEAPKRVKSESFDIVRVTSSRRNAATVTGTVKHVDDILHVDGTLPKGSSYKVEAWRVENGKAVEKVSESKTHVLDHDTTGDIQVNDVPAPTKAGTYQFRHYVWTPDTLGGDPSVTDAMAVIDPDATTGYKYAKRHLLADGDSDESERFEMVSIDTYVAKTNNVKTYKGKHYVDVTDGADVYDHAEITGNLPAGYRLGFTLYKEGRSEAADVAVATIPPTNLTEASKELDSATVHLTEPGTYYWVYSFSGADGQTWIDGDGSPELKELISKHRIPDETFNAVRVTTTTAKWTSKGGETVDVARIEGCLPDDATMNFELHDYQTGDKVAETGETSLAKLGYKPCEQGGDEVQTVESPKVTLPDAADHYFVESVKFGSDEFHRGNDKVSHESTRTIDATTDTSVEYTLGTAVADHADLLNIRYVGKDGKDIRDDLTGPLTASWELYRQADGDDASKDEKVADVDKDGVALESGQTEVESSPYKPDGTGLYYYVITIRDENGDVVKRGAAREPSESFRIIKAESKTDRVVSEGTKVRDRVTISGPVAEGTMVSWTLMKYGEGSADTDSVVKRYDTPADGAVLVTAKQAAEAAKSKTVINGPEFEGGKAGENYYWVFGLSSPARDGETGEPLKPKGAADTSHLAANSIAAIDAEVDGDGQEPQVDIQRFMTDRSRVEDESFNTVKVTTMASSHDATVGDKVHDTAIITGDIPNDGYCVSFEYWKRNDGDVRNDHLNDTSECVAVPAHATTVDSPERTVVEPGEHYYRERLTERGNGREVSYGEARVKGETVLVRLAPTGVAAAGAAGAMLAVAGLGVTLGLASRRRRHVGAHARV